MNKSLENQTRDLLLDVRISKRYHERRRQFFKTWSIIVVVINILSGPIVGGIVFWNPKGFGWIAVVVACLASVLTVLDAVAGISRSKTIHDRLVKRFAAFEKSFPNAGHLNSQKQIEGVASEHRAVVNDEETARLSLLEALCKYEIAQRHEDFRKIRDSITKPLFPFYRRWSAQFFSQADYCARSNSKRVDVRNRS